MNEAIIYSLPGFSETPFLQNRVSSRILEILPKRKLRLGFLNIRDPETPAHKLSWIPGIKKSVRSLRLLAFLNPGRTPILRKLWEDVL